MKKIVLFVLCFFVGILLYSEDLSVVEFGIVFNKPQYISIGFYDNEACTTKANDVVFTIPTQKEGGKSTTESSFYLKWDCTTQSKLLKLSMIMSSGTNSRLEQDSMLKAPNESDSSGFLNLNYNTTVKFLDTAETKTINIDSQNVDQPIEKDKRTIILFELTEDTRGNRVTNKAEVNLKISQDAFMNAKYTGYITLMLESL